MRFALIDGAKAEFPVHRLCRVLGVSQSGYFAWRSRPACRRQRDDMVLLAHVRSAFALSNSTYGSPRMTRELRDSGLTVGRRRIARLMRDNGLRARQKRRFKRTTDSHHVWGSVRSFHFPDEEGCIFTGLSLSDKLTFRCCWGCGTVGGAATPSIRSMADIKNDSSEQ